jgi:hypothetical protein
MVNPYNELPTTQPMPQAPSQDIQQSIDYLAKLTKNEHTADSRYRRNQAKNG